MKMKKSLANSSPSVGLNIAVANHYGLNGFSEFLSFFGCRVAINKTAIEPNVCSAFYAKLVTDQAYYFNL